MVRTAWEAASRRNTSDGKSWWAQASIRFPAHVATFLTGTLAIFDRWLANAAKWEDFVVLLSRMLIRWDNEIPAPTISEFSESYVPDKRVQKISTLTGMQLALYKSPVFCSVLLPLISLLACLLGMTPCTHLNQVYVMTLHGSFRLSVYQPLPVSPAINLNLESGLAENIAASSAMDVGLYQEGLESDLSKPEVHSTVFPWHFLPDLGQIFESRSYIKVVERQRV